MARRSLMDRALGAFGLTRKRGTRGYAGAKVGASTLDWITGITSADRAIKGDLRKLRDRSRSLVRDFSYASRFVQSVAENVAGPHGVTLQVRVEGAPALNAEVEAKWAEWCQDPTVEGGLAFADVEHLLCEALPQDGAFLVRLVTGYPGNRFRFAIQVLDSDQLEHTYERAGSEGVNEIRQGKELDRWGRPVAYYLWTHHPSEYGRGTRKLERVPAHEILHGYIRRRPGQSHGVPWFAPVLVTERMLAGFEEAAITAARTGAASAWSLEADADKVSGDEIPAEYSLEVEPGQGMITPLGYKLNWNDPTFPNEAIDPFCRYMLQSISSGLGVSHLTLTGDLRGANYSSMRAGLLPERDMWRKLHGWFTRSFHEHVYRAWLKAATLAGAVDITPSQMDQALEADVWQHRGFWSVDPDKELSAAQKEVAMGLNSRTRLAAQKGLDFEQVLADLKRENELAEEYGVTLGEDQYAESFSAEPPPQAGATDGEDASAEGAADSASGDGDRDRRLRLARRIG